MHLDVRLPTQMILARRIFVGVVLQINIEIVIILVNFILSYSFEEATATCLHRSDGKP